MTYEAPYNEWQMSPSLLSANTIEPYYTLSALLALQQLEINRENIKKKER